MNWKKLLIIVSGVAVFFALALGTVKGVQFLGERVKASIVTRQIPADSSDTGDGIKAETVPSAGEKASSETKEKAVTLSSESSGKTIKRSETLPDTKVIALDVSGVVEECMPQVVSITNTAVIKQQGYSSIYDYFYGRGSVTERTLTASGSGVIIEETEDELLIVTNRHVIENAKEIAVTFIDGETVDALVKGSSDEMDIAIIAIPLTDIKESTKEQIRIAKLHDHEDLKCGQGVIAIGNALGYGQSVTVGVISALDRSMDDAQDGYSNLIQTDAAINPGNSGGALLNNNGELIGINVAKYAETTVEGMGFSIPIYYAIEVMENLANAKTKVEVPLENQGRLGIYMNTIDELQSTALNIPAGVIVVGFSDEETEGYDLVEDSPAREAGILKNDIITKFDGQKVTDAQALANLVKYYEAGTSVDITVQRINNGEYEEHVIPVVLGKRTLTEEEKKAAEEQAEEQPEEQENAVPDTENKKKDKDKDREEKDEDHEDDLYEGEDPMYEFFKKFLEQYQ